MATPKIGSVRMTSNGCKVARRVPRKDARCRQPSSNIAAIDFGTANCSLAYIIAGEMTDNGPNLLPLHGTVYRVPTAILFRKDGTVKAFGDTARRLYRNLDDGQRLEWAYFEQIKMDLQQDESVNREMKVKAKNGTEYYLVEVIAHILKYLKDELIKKLKRAEYHLEATDFDWVITVPAIWRARGKQMMREAGYKAGLCSNLSLGKLKNAMTGRHPHIPDEVSPEKLTLVLEPEAAAIYCQNMTLQQRALYCDAPRPFTSNNYLVIDVGGGTVDIVAYRVSTMPEPHVEVIHQPAGDAWGGTKVNGEFEKFLEKIVGDEGFSKYMKTTNEGTNAEHRAQLNELIYETFESQKTIFGDKELDDDGKIAVQLPYTFFQEYEVQLEHNVQEMRDAHSSEVHLSGTELRIAYSKLKEFYTPVVKGILTCIAEVLEGADVEIDAVYLVGGFGGCHYLHEVVKARFGDRYKYLTPESPDFAVVRGAVLMQKNPQLIKSRRVDATYGVRVSIPFEEGKHEETYRWPAKSEKENEYQCTNIFSTFVERGDVVNVQDAFMMSYAPERPDQERMTVEIYSSSEKDVWYTTGKRPSHSSTPGFADVQKIGELIVPFPKSDSEESDSQEVEVLFDFSSTEIQVKGYDSKSNTEVRVVLDFLEG